ncbi:MAG TPA: Sua5/YciO/YrdC/YwlC family protein, partial [Puia sp.]|nr:Sua5/YciO/YrdC/YwlC family protein [Puia sp.]
MEFEKDIENCLAVLQAGGLILYPTDTVWGIGCDATNTSAVAKVYTLKQRVAAKSLIVLMADERDVLKYTSQPDLRVFDYLQTVSKPTTVVYEGAIGLADNLINEDGTVA